MHFNSKATPTNDTNYNCLIKAVELLQSSYQYLLLLGADAHIHTRHQQNQFVETRCTTACSWHASGLQKLKLNSG